MHISESDLQQIFGQISYIGIVALDEVISGGSADRGESVTLGDTLADRGEGPIAAFEVEEMKQILSGAINRLGDREKMVLSLYYYENLTLSQIGQVLGVTESRVCQIHTKAIMQLRGRLRWPNAERRVDTRPAPTETSLACATMAGRSPNPRGPCQAPGAPTVTAPASGARTGFLPEPMGRSSPWLSSR